MFTVGVVGRSHSASAPPPISPSIASDIYSKSINSRRSVRGALKPSKKTFYEVDGHSKYTYSPSPSSVVV